MEDKDFSQNNSKNKDLKSIAQDIVKKIESESPELFDNYPHKEELTEKVLSFCKISFSYEEHEGPLPPPHTLKEYDLLVENGAERIMKIFEIQSTHRQALEKKVVNGQVNQSLLGQFLGFVIAIICLGLGTYLVMNGHETAGIALFSLDIVGLVSIFVIGRYQRKKSLKINE